MSNSDELGSWDSLDIAVVGMSGRFPGARNVDEFWRNLCDGVECITRFSDEELLAAGVDRATLSDPNYVKAGAILSDIELFDASFFGLAPREAQIMDPQHRLFLEEIWTLIERAGYDPDVYEGAIGVYAGAGMSTYLLRNLLPNFELLASIGHLAVLLGNDKDSLTTRAAYLLGLTGPCYTLQTYCSTSLVAVSVACEALAGGQCDMAVAGGVMVQVPQRVGYAYQEGGITSPDGRCRAFDAKAKGAPLGNGVAVVLLKRLADAVADGDTVHAVIKGWAVNNDGALRVGYTAPGVRGQSGVITQALANAGVDAASLSYIEAHGTGTALGDAVEFQALVRAFDVHTDKKGFCAIGSVKTNIGHIDRAAGAAGLIKTVLALEHKLIPPSLNYDEPNREIDFANTPFYVNTELCEWKALDGGPRRAGVSSFGIGGTNAHVILEEAPALPLDEPPRSEQLLLLSARSSAALESMTDDLCAHLRQHPHIQLADVAFTLQVGRKSFEHRRMLVCEGREDALEALEARHPARLAGRVQPTRERPVAFMFGGVGDHYVHMAGELYQVEPTFRGVVDRCCDLLWPILGLDLRDVLYPEGDGGESNVKRQGSKVIPTQEEDALGGKGLNLRQMVGRGEGGESGCVGAREGANGAISRAEYAQPAVFVIEYALTRLLASWGIVPDALIGHSLGEYVAACVSGVLSLEDALMLTARRAQMIQRLPAGGMLAVSLSEEEARFTLEGPVRLDDRIDLAVVNGPGTCVLAGPEEAIGRLERRLTGSGIACRRLGTSRAVHSAMMEPIADEYAALVRTVELHPPRIPLLSNVSGRWIGDAEATDPSYWGRHLCQTVRFGDGLVELLQDRERVLLEVGPGQSLSSFAKQHPACAREQWPHILSTLRCAYERRSDCAFILEMIGKLWLTGTPIDWRGYYYCAGERRRRVPLPTYPFERKRYWIDPPQGALALERSPAAPTSQQRPTGKKADIADWFYVPVWKASSQGATDDRPGRLYPTPNSKGWLIFEDRLGWGARLGQRLSQPEGVMASAALLSQRKEQSPRPGAPIVRVQAGERFAQLERNLFMVRSAEPDDYRTLLETLQESGQVPAQIVHMWSVTEPGKEWASIEAFGEAQRVGFYSLLYLAQAIGAQSDLQDVRITVVSNDVQPVGDGPLCPEKATILGLSRVVQQEYPHIRCHSVDVMLPASHDAGNSEGEEALLDQLAAELTCAAPDVAVAYRAGIRYVLEFEPRRLAEDATTERLRPGGVYLITGGLGAIGSVLARYLVQSVQARLVLIGRSELPARDEWAGWLAEKGDPDPISRKIQLVQALEGMGAEVLVMAADVSDEGQMQAVVERTHERFGPLNGVIHAAGITSPGALCLIQMMDRAACECHFRPKAYGLYVLDRVLEGEELDFCLLFSSLSSVLGGLGFAAYAAANVFMDAYVCARNRTREHTWISVNWDTWRVGREESTNALGATVAEFEMAPEEGVRALARVLGSGETLVVHSTGDLDARIRQWVMLDAWTSGLPAGLDAVSRPELATAYAPASNEVERRIAAIWQSVLGIDRVGIHDNFLDLGGNSLIGLQLIATMQKEFGVQIPAIALFEAPTVSSLARVLQPDSTVEEDDGPIGDDARRAEEAALAERRRQARQSVGDRGIAIIGMACRFPGANDVPEFWENLCHGVESLTLFGDEELLKAGVAPELLDDPNYVKARPIIEGTELFDARFFGYSPREAELMDPQHRFFLECACEALELAGYAADKYKGLIGVFGGTNFSSYMLSLAGGGGLGSTEAINLYQAIIGNDKDSLTTTVSYKLGLRGPSVAVQTFCSTSLVAVHMACSSLLNGESDIALAGGVSIRVPQRAGYVYQPGGMESPDGHCRTFDARAQGTMFGDGVGIVVLKRLEDALEDGDTISAVIRGSAMNNDGSLKVGYTAPSVIGQAEVVAAALENAGIDPQTLGYVEAHGTATELGDPVEVASLTRAFRRYTDEKGTCAIGSVKTNFGHLDRAAGVSGLIKAALVVKHGIIPPSLHFESPNPKIDLKNSPFYVNATLSEWPRRDGAPRRAGVNSLGMGGTNVHVIVEEPPKVQPPERAKPSSSRSWQLLVLSARTESALDTMTENLVHYMQQNPDVELADMAFTLQRGRRTFEQRRMLVCRDLEDALRALEGLDPRRVLTHYQPAVSRPIVFMFPGVGDHYPEMTRELYETESVFRDVIEKCCTVLHPYLGVKLRDLLYSEEPSRGEYGASRGEYGASPLRRVRAGRAPDPKLPNSQLQTRNSLRETAVAQPVVFAVEYALACLLMSWGVRPQALAGYSLGEYVAACVSGVLSLEDALRLVAERAQMIGSLPQGRMLSVALSIEAARPLLCEEIWLAIHSAKRTCVLAGPAEAIARLETQLAQRGIAYRPLDTTHAFHSGMMAPVAEQLTEVAKGMQLGLPRIPYISNVTGTWITNEQATDPAYWARHMCQPVRFYRALSELLGDVERILLEVGPGQSLGTFAKQHPNCAHEQIGLILPTVRYATPRAPAELPNPAESDLAFLLGTVGRLWLLDVELDWARFYSAESRHRIPLPTYPFERQRYWIERDRGQAAGRGVADRAQGADSTPPRKDLADWFYLPGWKQTAPHPPSLRGGDPSLRSGQATRRPPGMCWLLFVDECGLGTKVATWLAGQGQQVVTVQVGTAFEQLDERRYAIEPGSRPDYEALLHQLRQQGLVPGKVVHMWSVTGDDGPRPGEAPSSPLQRGKDLSHTLNLGLYSLVCLVQAIGKMNLESCELSIVSSQVQSVTGHESICPEKATVIGPCRVVPLEYANVACRSIDVSLTALKSWQEEALLIHLLGELTADFSEPVVALRGHQRWVETFEPVSLPPVRTEEVSRLRPNGVYLITGGLGGIGLALAEHLAQAVGARLVLISRSGLPPRTEWAHILATEGEIRGVGRKIRGVQRLEELGAEVLVAPADVADEEEMRAVIEEALRRFGAIHGFIHAAGVPGMGLTQLKSPEAVAEVLRPKVAGTLVLERVLQGIELDFAVLFSSITSITGGGPGQLDYCAANAFLDAYAWAHIGEAGLTTAVNWGEWQWNAWEEGLAGFDDRVQAFLRENRKRFGIAFDEGYDALERILSRNLPRVVASTQDFGEVVKGSRFFTAANILQQIRQGQASGPKHPRPALGVPYVAPSSELERQIATLWSETLGIAEIGVNDNFFDLGGNSLVGLDLVSRLQKGTAIEAIPAHMLYEAPSVRAMAAYLERDQEEEEKAAMVVADLQAQGERRRARLQQRKRRAEEST